MVQVHVPAKEWGFDSPLGHHIPLDVDERRHAKMFLALAE